MNIKLLLTTLFFLLFNITNAQETKEEPIKITHGPYLCDMSQDGVTVVWSTNKPALSWVEFREHSSKSFYAEEHKKHFEILNGRKQAHKTLHIVRLNNLKPGAKYQYRVYSKEVLQWKNNDNIIYGNVASTNVYNKTPLTFKTFKSQSENISFMMLNDIHGRADFMKQLCSNVEIESLDFVMFNGDMANSIESEEQIFTHFVDAAVDMFASEVPIMYCRGNHETRGKYADHLIEYFPTTDERFYHFSMIGSTAFLILDCGEDKPDSDIEYSEIAAFDEYRIEQAKWLSKTIENSEFKNAKKRIVFLHIPPTPNSWHGAEHLMQHFIPILNKAKIDVMFSGHTHKYSFHPSDSLINFPMIVNSNNTYLKCDVTPSGIDVQIINQEGKVEQKHSLK